MFSKMRTLKKRGLSNIVAGAFLVLLSLIAIGLLWVYIGNVINETVLSPAFSCLDMQLDPPINIQKACYNNNTGDMEINVLRKGDNLNLDSLYFISNSLEEDSKTWCCGVDCEGCGIVESGESKDYYFEGSGDDTGRNVVLSIFGCAVDQMNVESCE